MSFSDFGKIQQFSNQRIEYKNLTSQMKSKQSKLEAASQFPLELYFDSSIDFDCSDYYNSTIDDHLPVWVMVTLSIDDNHVIDRLVDYNISFDCQLSQ